MLKKLLRYAIMYFISITICETNLATQDEERQSETGKVAKKNLPVQAKKQQSETEKVANFYADIALLGTIYPGSTDAREREIAMRDAEEADKYKKRRGHKK